jgi:hypothetical protein
MQDELELAELLNTDMTVMLADKIIRVTMGVIKDVPDVFSALLTVEAEVTGIQLLVMCTSDTCI